MVEGGAPRWPLPVEPKEGSTTAGVRLVKSHGLVQCSTYREGKNFTCTAPLLYRAEAGGQPADRLGASLWRQFGQCVDDAATRVRGVRGIVRLERNPFDTLVARWSHARAQHHAQAAQAAPQPAGWASSFGLHARKDACVMMQWLHRARHVACPATLLRYEDLYTAPSSFASAVRRALLGAGQEDRQATGAPSMGYCLADLRSRPLRYPAASATPLPFYLHSHYDARLVRYVSGAIEHYLRASDGLASRRLVSCVATAAAASKAAFDPVPDPVATVRRPDRQHD
jgi:hypothetical protein